MAPEFLIDRVYGVVSFPTKYDKTGALVRKFCPELAKFPDKVNSILLFATKA